MKVQPRLGLDLAQDLTQPIVLGVLVILGALLVLRWVGPKPCDK